VIVGAGVPARDVKEQQRQASGWVAKLLHDEENQSRPWTWLPERGLAIEFASARAGTALVGAAS